MSDLCKKGATKHCCHGICNSDSRYAHREHMQGVFFIRFPKPWRDIEKCKRWVNSCKRDGFSTEKITKDTYICSKHFVGGKGPTIEHPDPLPATATESDIKKYTTKRKAPSYRQDSDQPRKRARKTMNQELETNEGPLIYVPDCSNTFQTITDEKNDKCIEVKPNATSTSTQTDKNINIGLEIKIENSMLKNRVKLLENEVDYLKTSGAIKIQSELNTCEDTSCEFTVENVMMNESRFKYYTGLTISQFMCLWEYLGPSKHKLVYWNSDCENPDKSPTKRSGPKHKMEPKNELFMT